MQVSGEEETIFRATSVRSVCCFLRARKLPKVVVQMRHSHQFVYMIDLQTASALLYQIEDEELILRAADDELEVEVNKLKGVLPSTGAQIGRY